MGSLVNFLRSVVFLILMFFWFPAFTASISLTRRRPLRGRYAYACRGNIGVTLKIFEKILGIRHRVIGLENLPKEATVIMSKHQSAWETIAFYGIFPSIAFVLKRELLRIPFFGWGLAQMPIVSIDRSAGKDALRQVVDQGRELLDQGFSVLVFPEGTRTMIGKRARSKIGGAKLATATGVPVVPVAHNAGEFWSRQSFIKKAGWVTVSIGPAIPTAGRPPEEVCADAEAWIENEMRCLFPHHYTDTAKPGVVASRMVS
jgi:1-acyl-sn-glycerol-3-phosphate acyltransferase